MEPASSELKQRKYIPQKDTTTRRNICNVRSCNSEHQKRDSTTVHSPKPSINNVGCTTSTYNEDIVHFSSDRLTSPPTNVNLTGGHESNMRVSSHSTQFSTSESITGQSPTHPKHNTPASPTRSKLKIMPFTLPFAANRTNRPVVLSSVPLEDGVFENHQNDGSHKFIANTSSSPVNSLNIYTEKAANNGGEDVDNEFTATQQINKLFEPVLYIKETTAVTYSSASRPIPTSTELHTSVCTSEISQDTRDNTTKEEYLQYNTYTGLHGTAKPVVPSVEDIAMAHISKRERYEVDSIVNNFSLKDVEQIMPYNVHDIRDDLSIISNEESQMNGPEIEYWEENSGCHYMDEVDIEQDEPLESEEEKSKNKCKESLKREEQIKQMILKEMTLVKLRYKKSYKDDIPSNEMDAWESRKEVHKQRLPDDYDWKCSSDAFPNIGDSKANMNILDMSYSSLSANYGSLSEPHLHECSNDDLEGHIGQPKCHYNIDWPRYSGDETDL